MDLLHIDGRHRYDDVRHDFQSWQRKLSGRAVVLLHDTNERRSGFGVWQFWSELQPYFAHFEFLHAHGLGVLAVGPDCPEAVRELTRLRSPETIGAVRDRFAQLGERGMRTAQVKLLSRALDAERRRVETFEARLAAMQDDAARASEALAATQTRLQAARREAEGQDWARARADRATAQARLAQLEAESQLREQRSLAVLELTAREEATRRETAERALADILNSGTWRATIPVRSILARVKPGQRRAAFRIVQRAWRLFSPNLNHLRRPAPAADASPPASPTVSPRPAPPAVPVTDICYVSGEPHTPGTHYRVVRYAAACAAAGARTAVLRLDELPENLAAAGRCGTVVLWRVRWGASVAAFVAAARAAGARIVFDIDDLMVDPALARTAVIDGIRSLHLTEEQVRADFGLIQQTMLAADFCFASTEELAGHMRRFGKPCLTLPNGFDEATLLASRMAARQRALLPGDGLLRVGYAGGTRTHQRDFAVVAPAMASLLRAHPDCRLVLFRPRGEAELVSMDEFPELAPLMGQIEWRDMVALEDLPAEMARFDVNLVPLEVGNPFCEAKSELKFFEAALAGVCTVASPTGPYARAIEHGRTGMLADTQADWEATIGALLQSPARRQAMARQALQKVLWTYGPDRRAQCMRRVMAEWNGGASGADAFALRASTARAGSGAAPDLPDGTVAFSADRLRPSAVTVMVPVFNYAHTLVETLDSVRAQTLDTLDLVVVDDGSSDGSLEVALEWLQRHAARFNRIVLVRNGQNAGLGASRNVGFSHAETPWLLPLDADNLLRPACCETLLAAARESGAAFAYPVIQEFGGRTGVMGTAPFEPHRLVGGNYIDAMALVARSAWAAVGGYASMRDGWEDYDFWCALAEAGLHGVGLGGDPLADYRVHAGSMLAQVTDIPATKARVIQNIERRHPWLHVTRE